MKRRYIIKFSTDGAILSKTKSAVQGTMKLIAADENGKVQVDHDLPQYFDKEITLYYYIGKFKYLDFKRQKRQKERRDFRFQCHSPPECTGDEEFGSFC